MVVWKKGKKYATFIAIGLLSITLVLVLVFGEKHFGKRKKDIYEGCKNVMVTPNYKVVMEKDY